MKTLRGRVSTTRLDSHGERFTREALEGAAKQREREYVPVMWNHDPRIAPLGRVVAAEVVSLDDDEYGLDSIIQIWEANDDAAQLRGDGREIPLQVDDHPMYSVVVDRSFQDREGKQLVADLRELAGDGCEVSFYGKKAVDPVSTLMIAAGAFAVGGLANGFFGRLGSDLYDALSRRLGAFYERRQLGDGLLDLLLVAERGSRRFEVHILVSRPREASINSLFDGRFEALDAIVIPIAEHEPDLAKVVLEWRDGRLCPLYAVRRDAVPTIFDLRAAADQIPEHISIGFNQPS